MVADDDPLGLAVRFDAARPQLLAVAQRMLGSRADAEDAVQEAWLRLARSDVRVVENRRAWLTTVVTRVALDTLRLRRAKREVSVFQGESPATSERSQSLSAAPDPAQDALLADAIGPALLLVLDTLAPEERVAFVLHDAFGMPFDEIGQALDRTPAAARQLASRGRRRVRGQDGPDDPRRARDIVRAFLAAARDGDFEDLLTMLAPDVVLRADAAAAAMGTPAVQGQRAVARFLAGRAMAARTAIVDGRPAVVWAQAGQLKVIFDLTVVDGVVTSIRLRADPVLLAAAHVTALPAGTRTSRR